MIFASGRPLKRLVAQGLMRADFFFRLEHGVSADLRPLRENPEEVVRHCQLFGVKNQVVVGSKLTDFYRTLPWPGNIRQLYGHLLAKKIRSKTRKLDFDGWDEKLLTMSSDLQGISHSEDPIRSIEVVKREYARQAFRRCSGEITRTARELCVNPKTLKGWLQEA
jgi:transcriptional regulator of acetoin/glycerol metabolism